MVTQFLQNERVVLHGWQKFAVDRYPLMHDMQLIVDELENTQF